MANKKIETFLYEDLGFPIKLIDAPMRKTLGEWVLDIDLNKLQIRVLELLISQLTPLLAEELRFIRKYFEMTTTTFGEFFGVTHVAVLKWERGLLPSPPMDICIRMFVMQRLHVKDVEFKKLLKKISLTELSKAKKNKVNANVHFMNMNTILNQD